MPTLNASFSARAAERLFPPSNEGGRDSSRGLAFVVATLIYVVLIAPLAIEFGRSAPPSPPEAEIPVEIVVEPPPAPEPTKAPQPPKQAQPLDEKPAYDAPRSGQDEKLDSEIAGKPPEPAPSPPPQPPGAAEDNSPKLSAKQDAPNAEKLPVDAPPMPLSPEGDLAPQQQAKAEPQTPAPEPAAPSGPKIPLFNQVPDVDFGGPVKYSKVSGGNSQATYLSTLYGMIVPRLRRNPNLRSMASGLTGTIVFGIDDRGRLTQRWIAEASGSNALDNAAYEAVGAASPFPPPPGGMPRQIRFTYSPR